MDPAERRITVSRERLAGWLTRFEIRHPGLEVLAGPDLVQLTASDGAIARITVPFPPLGEPGPDPTTRLLDHVRHDRRIGVLLARKGGWAIGLFDGAALLTSKVDSRYVQGTTKAGGWSQQRYARRRTNQAAHAFARAADDCAALLIPEVLTLDAVVTGGHRSAVEAVLADDRLHPLRELADGRVLPTAEPRLRVLQAFAEQMLAVEIGLNEFA